VEADLPCDQKCRLFERSEFPAFPQRRSASKAISVLVLIFWYFCIKTKVQAVSLEGNTVHRKAFES
jgi:hypothetical protein